MRISNTFLISLVVALNTLSASNSEGQIAIHSGPTAQQMAHILQGPGVTISNEFLSSGCANTPNAYATFSNGLNSNLGISSGVVLTTGSASNAYSMYGNDDDGSVKGSCNSSVGDSDLDYIAGAATYDACALEFDVVPVSDSIRLTFVFASEEYLEFVGSGYNDAFAFFINGPDITGNRNIALIPGTNTAVTIDSLNNMINSAYYVDNGDGSSPIDSTQIQYDGFTLPLTARVKVNANATYHLKIVIADANDCIYDSGIFLEEGSVSSTFVTATNETLNERINSGYINQNVPNPFNKQTKISFDIPASTSKAQLEIYNTLGEMVKTIHINERGNASVELAENDLVCGMYLYRLIADGKAIGTKMMLKQY